MDTGFRTSTNAGVAGAASILLIWILSLFGVVVPVGFEAAIATFAAWLVARFSKTQKDPGLL